ncbi:family 10 glycosylhydrolase [Romeria aff. gracilis LEGE 07310]|uniref:Family 10 glycosylhydrolase n=1 Tax=Vasconcelosia minhoensis LEGE 07310 TaxID=915328 RepID=A0A8J7DR18_9CYAN|nr:family 10 glycosylhydrolase [Romeria gracilis]MBE9077554.1 family 10 glycosylhydrolase [Romeria aff. gracilis LEGE 07310]
MSSRTELRLAQALPPEGQSAPPAIPVGSASFDPQLLPAMRQELENLVGRYESALLIVNAQGQPTRLQADAIASPRTASLTPANTRWSLPPILTHAQQLLQDWPSLVNQGDYETLWQRWLQSRQALQTSFPTDQRLAQPEIRAIWLDRGTIVQAGSAAGLTGIFDRLAAAGINTVFVETVNAGYPIYPSQVAPQQNPLTRGWDPLRAAIALGHQRGIEVHAWVWVFAAGNERHNPLVNRPISYPGPVLAQHPDWAAYDNRGRLTLSGQTKPFYDPANPEVRSYIQRLLGEIATSYDVDGIHLDYIRYPFQDPAANRTFGYGRAARQQFEQRTGVDPFTLTPPGSTWLVGPERQRQQLLWEQWTDFRVEQVSTFVAEASQELRRLRPNLVISAAVFAQSEYERRQVLQQDWNRWAIQGDLDWIVLMSYALDTPRFETLIRPWTVEADYGATLIIPGIRLLPLVNAAALDQIQLLRDLPVSGYALFAAENLNGSLQKILAVTQGSARDSPPPQQQPFATAAARYQALQQEWNWLLSQQLLEMPPYRLEQWTAEANQLGDELAALAANPSRQGVTAARSRLRLLQNHLGSGFTLHMASAPYRRRTWQYHLTTIERLLVYGEEHQLR